MPKAYWIAHVTVTDPAQYQLYAQASAAPFAEYGAKILARGGTYQALEGADHPRNVVIEFPSLQHALDCYHSDAYQAARALRENAGIPNITIVEGV
ncbi:DUF1330 domain-containing protein [Cognatishimia sp. 1_MG-2023]|uniref:DUF1330 domain-containing protein n=1 Tax=Cognatishimia sp. 1_MG-2023 TaxID=3062642 RepID=UPI0026E31595|nr:DUF1330 domain-containing protein [Cognatishimia sp. 1_MG-2023]MDO6726656.1 DUF1330 domain-containing protein [Cognatishimia sp. 1_MG-2023]